MDNYKPLVDRDLKHTIDQARDLFQYLHPRDQVINLAK